MKVNISQQASTTCSDNILVVILRRSTALTTVSSKSAEQVMDPKRMQYNRRELINYRKKIKRFGSEMKILEHYAIFSEIYYYIQARILKKKPKKTPTCFQCQHSKQSSLKMNQRISRILSRSAITITIVPRNGRSLGKFPNVQHMLWSWKLEPHDLLWTQAVPN